MCLGLERGSINHFNSGTLRGSTEHLLLIYMSALQKTVAELLKHDSDIFMTDCHNRIIF